MTRLFRRGELRDAVLAALAEIEPANGYAIMQALGDAVGSSWRPSPGAVYPAILGLEDAGLITGAEDDTGTVVYELTSTGRTAHAEVSDTLELVAERARHTEPTHTLGSLLDTFVTDLDGRSQRLDPATASAVTRVLARTTTQLERILNRENNTDG
jgi:DNA-binding PadR family transcriptional regulator